jgi:hypothetical protein
MLMQEDMIDISAQRATESRGGHSILSNLGVPIPQDMGNELVLYVVEMISEGGKGE